MFKILLQANEELLCKNNNMTKNDYIKKFLEERAKTCTHENVFFVGTSAKMTPWCKYCGSELIRTGEHYECKEKSSN
jgi:ribosomal protein S27E